jgi:hypothetical protein
MEHHAIFTESVPKVASIELIKSSFESADVGAQNSQRHWLSKSLAYTFPKTELEKYDRNIQAYRSVAEPWKAQKRGRWRYERD